MEKLIVRNFGAINEVELELKNLTIFIGKSGTGKSTLAKLIAIFRDVAFWTKEKTFEKLLEEKQLRLFTRSNTYIEFSNKYFSFIYKNKKGKIDDNRFYAFLLKLSFSNALEDLEDNVIRVGYTNLIYQSFTIPAERLLTSYLSEYYASLSVKSEVIDLLPKTLLDFVGEFNSKRNKMNETYIPIFDVTYQAKDGKDYIVLSDETKLPLPDAASSMQTTIPALLVLDYYAQNNETKKSFVFEEPELNLFPTAQKALVEFLAEKVLNNGHQLVICTHSPYILTSLNNLLYAHQVRKDFPDAKEKVYEVISQDKILDSENVAVYFLASPNELESDKVAVVSLLDEETGLIPDNELDSASEYIGNDFELLISIYDEYQNPNRKRTKHTSQLRYC